MDEVFLLKNQRDLGKVSGEWFSKVNFEGSKITIKLHFGEPGNKTALFPDDIKPIIDSLRTLGLDITMVDTPVAYDSQRNTSEGYLRAARQRGYEKLGKIKILDEYQDITTKDLTVQVAKGIIEAENLLVISHVKGHCCSGFGGAIKNFGMGAVSVKSKNDIHELGKPKYVSLCQGCGTCAKLCPANTIQMVEGKAKFDLNACYGCSICQEKCPYQCLKPRQAFFDDLLAQSASAVIGNLPKNTYYINIIKNITKFCDCEIDSGELIGRDLGILFSQNPVAIDKASVDLINRQEGKNIFYEIEHKQPLAHVDLAAKYTGKTGQYLLIEKNY